MSHSPGYSGTSPIKGIPSGEPGRNPAQWPTTSASASPATEVGEASLAQIDNLEDYLEEIERKLIMPALEETRWNRTAAAQRLGLTFRSMRYRLKKLGID